MNFRNGTYTYDDGEKGEQKMNSNQQIQLQQKIIHYRAEIASYKNKLKSLELELKKEKMRNQYLQEKLHQIQTVHVDQYEKKIAMLENQLLSYEVALEEEKKQMEALKKNLSLPPKESPLLNVRAFFNYSLILPEEKDEDVLVIGDFVIDNIGNTPLHETIVCIRLNPPEEAKLSGKIAINPWKNDESFNTEWTFASDDWREKIKTNGEYWIKPLQHTTLMPNEQLRFQNFEIRTKQTVVVEGFVYCKEIPKGTSSMNNIIINC
jgi:hypothetical protein